MSLDTIARATTSVVPLGRHPVASGLKTCAMSVIPVGSAGAVGDAVAVGAALVAAMVAVGVGEEAADVAAGGTEDEHAVISAAKATAIAVLTRGA
ncbi:MAG TPA: hypothetical protein VJ726_07200 [Candidatus Limnocylindria bacterium]|nr:hypothetical protein [Candidatus Limnocylindria bacterium]